MSRFKWQLAKDCTTSPTREKGARRHSPIVADRCKLPADVMGARAGLHADQAARNIGKTASKLTTGHLLLQNDGAPLVQPNQVERVLTKVDPDCGDSFRRLLRCAHRMLLELLRNASPAAAHRVGAGRGRASAARLAAIPAGESPANRGVQSLL